MPSVEKSAGRGKTVGKPRASEPFIEVVKIAGTGKPVKFKGIAPGARAQEPKAPRSSGFKIKGTLTKLVKTDDVKSNSQLDDLVRDGLPTDLVDRAEELIRLMTDAGVLPRKTIEDARKSKKGKLSPGISERVVRVVRMVQQSINALGEERALNWMQKSNKNFGGASAIEMAKTEYLERGQLNSFCSSFPMASRHEAMESDKQAFQGSRWHWRALCWWKMAHNRQTCRLHGRASCTCST